MASSPIQSCYEYLPVIPLLLFIFVPQRIHGSNKKIIFLSKTATKFIWGEYLTEFGVFLAPF